MFNKREFEAQLARKGVKKYEVAAELKMSYGNLYRKIETGHFTREEIGKLIKFLAIENPMEIFFADELT